MSNPLEAQSRFGDKFTLIQSTLSQKRRTQCGYAVLLLLLLPLPAGSRFVDAATAASASYATAADAAAATAASASVAAAARIQFC